MELNNCYFSTFSTIQSDLFDMFHFYRWQFFRKILDIIYVGVIYEIKMDGPLQTKYLYIQISTVKVDNWLLVLKPVFLFHIKENRFSD